MKGRALLDKWQMLQAIIADPELSARAKVVAAKLLDHANAKTGRCDPSYARIAKGTGVTRRNAIAAVKDLEAAGWLVIAHRGGNDAKGCCFKSNGFRFNWARFQDG